MTSAFKPKSRSASQSSNRSLSGTGLAKEKKNKDLNTRDWSELFFDIAVEKFNFCKENCVDGGYENLVKEELFDRIFSCEAVEEQRRDLKCKNKAIVKTPKGPMDAMEYEVKLLLR